MNRWSWILLISACSADSTPRDGALPFHYFLLSSPSGDLQRGFGVAEEESHGGAIRTRSGRVVPLENLEEARPVRGLGVDHLGVGWVVERHAGVWAHADDRETPALERALFDRVVLDPRPAPAGWVAVQGGFMRASEVRAPTPASRPVEVAPGERWIDVDTQAETVGVYDGDQARFVTLASTGQGRPHTRFATPRGVFRINYKVRSATMDNVDETLDGAAPYSFEEVPWVQYFHKEVALHGAYWHERFGHPVSHGCVNLAPADAQRVYALTRASTPAYAGTVVRVR